MAAPVPSRWIVLIQKSPKGPFTQAEVKALVDRGVVRLNDLAMQVTPASERGKSDWKFLWQFPEFNRRKPREGAAEAGSSAEDKAAAEARAQEERRRAISAEEEKRKLIESLPPDLAEIDPADLVSRPSRGGFRPDDDLSGSISEEGTSASSGGPRSWIAPGLALGLLAFGIFYWLGSTQPGPAASRSRSLPQTSPDGGGSASAPSPQSRTLSTTTTRSTTTTTGAPVSRPGSTTAAPPPVIPQRRDALPQESGLDTAADRAPRGDRDTGEIPLDEAMERGQGYEAPEDYEETAPARTRRQRRRPSVAPVQDAEEFDPNGEPVDRRFEADPNSTVRTDPDDPDAY